MAVKFNCFSCGTSIEMAHTPGRREECPKCRADLHVCKNCKNYDKTAYNECREPAADVVLEKERSNFCDYYDPAGTGPVKDAKKDLLAAAEALFKKK